MGASDDEELTINENFAGKYAHNKEREEVTRARELGLPAPGAALAAAADGDDSSSSSSSDDEDAELLTRGIDKQIQRTIEMIKRGDPAIYDAGTQLYHSDASESEEDEEEDGGDDSSDSSDSDGSSDSEGEGAAAAAAKPKKSKPLTMKDQLRERILKKMDNDESASDSGSDDDDGEAELTRPAAAAGPTFVEEQAALKQEFGKGLGSSSDRMGANLDDSDSDSDGGLFSVRTKTAEEQAEQDEVIERSFAKMAESQAAKEKAGDEILARAALGDSGFGKKLIRAGEEAAMEEQTEMDASEFLNDYIMNQRWLDKPSKKRKKRKAASAEVGEDDEEFDETLDKFEAAYNFRFEEAAASGGSVDIVGHARRQGAAPELGLARRPDDRRKTQRANKKKRKEVRDHLIPAVCPTLRAVFKPSTWNFLPLTRNPIQL